MQKEADDALAAVDSNVLLKGRASLESDRLSGLHLDGFAGTRIERFPGLGLPHGEGTKRGKCEATIRLELMYDGIDHVRCRTVCRNACAFEGVLKN